MIKFYNTLSRRKDEFVPYNRDDVKMYACGITVSGNAHVGHLYQALIYDLIRKVLVKDGYKVTYARNYTDIDDKIIAKANELKVDSKVFAKQMIEKIDEEMKYFQVDEPDIWLKATENIDNIINFVQRLIDKGYAYVTKNGDVYYSVNNFHKYGALSGRNLEDAQKNYRIENDEEKRNSLDFALWKSAKEGEPYWLSPWGKGRPGWHIECSCMNMVAFGNQIDIHGGGRDLIFPHHENEIAQTEALTGQTFAKYWIHNGLIKVDGQKMSKSLGNTITLEDLRGQYHPEVVKFALFQNSYRSDINITENLFKQAEKHIEGFYSLLNKIEDKYDLSKIVIADNEYETLVDEALKDDFNTPKALSYLFEIFKKMQKKFADNDSSVAEDCVKVKGAYKILGLFVNDSNAVLKFIENKDTIPEEIKKFALKRWQAKLAKQYAQADLLRQELLTRGYSVLDNKDGYKITKL